MREGISLIFWVTNAIGRLLLLKLDKQISGTIYWPILAANKAKHLEGVGCHVGGGGCSTHASFDADFHH